MDLFEYQGKQYLAQFGIPIPQGVLAKTVPEALEHSAQIDFPLVVKAQVLVGGRGKAGGIRLCQDAAELTQEAERILGMDIRGHTVERIWLEEAAEIEAEYYASFTLDRGRKRHLGMLSRQGGVEIETVAAEQPDAIARLQINPVKELTREAIEDWLDVAGLAGVATKALITFLHNLYRCYLEGDATLVEINPLILNRAGKAIALDAKVTLDPAASFRHPEWDEFSENPIPDPRERLAKQFGLQYVGLSGTVGIIANGAGLAMSTVDIVDQVGGSAANFLDIGGGANAQRMADALSVIHQDENVRVVFINIFGGITRCDEIANGILQAMREVELRCPLVVRLDGTNAVEGRSILANHSQEWLRSEADMLNAAKRAVELASSS